MPPQQGKSLLNIVGGAGDFRTHAPGYKEVGWEGKVFPPRLSV
jgi:hypothetical protein